MHCRTCRAAAWLIDQPQLLMFMISNITLSAAVINISPLGHDKDALLRGCLRARQCPLADG